MHSNSIASSPFDLHSIIDILTKMADEITIKCGVIFFHFFTLFSIKSTKVVKIKVATYNFCEVCNILLMTGSSTCIGFGVRRSDALFHIKEVTFKFN